jgi:hypothetical protein
MMRPAPIACLIALMPVASLADEPPDLKMSKPIVCAKIHAFADVEPLPDATLTPDDKLTVYYQPSGYTIEKTRDGFRALFAQDGRIRKKGSKDALWQKAPMFEYEAKDTAPPHQIYMRSDFALKGLAPGDYELDLTLHDRLAKGAKVVRTVVFKVVPARPEGSEDGEKGGKPKVQGGKQKAERKGRTSG